MLYRLSCPVPKLTGKISLEPSKSISNRVLIIQSLSDEKFIIHRLSQSDDTKVLSRMLASDEEMLHSGHAGTSYRFMVARACLSDKPITLDGSAQMRKRPVSPLVNALRELGADIKYLQKEGFPPLLIQPNADLGRHKNEIHLHAGTSSQYVSALLMIAPVLPQGLVIHLSGDAVSAPYIRMTLEVMKWFGIQYEWSDDTIRISNQKYVARDYTVEGDWSAASYYYSLASLSEHADIEIEGLNEDCLQGDAVVKDIYQQFGVETEFISSGIRLKKKQFEKVKEWSYDFNSHPDLAQTVMVTLAGLGIKGNLSGLKTLRIKETDRLLAMQTELAKVKVQLEVIAKEGDIKCILTGRAKWKDKARFDTYDDHRMAMSLTPLACRNPVTIRNPEVVSKSYPGFWKDIEKIGVKVEKVRK